MEKFPILQNFFASSLWMMPLELGRTDPWVATLQSLLAELQYFPAERVTGYFGDVTEQAVCAFQQQALGISADSIWCGYFGPQTRSALHTAMLQNGVDTSLVASDDQVTLATKSEQETETAVVPEVATDTISDDLPEETPESPAQQVDEVVESEEEVVAETTEKKIVVRPTLSDEINEYYLSIGDTRRYKFLNPIMLGDSSREVKLLQRKLQWLGYYEDLVSGTYDTQTMQAVYAFQLDQGILQ
ncbi:MAG: peptidoglycan-binding protein [Candidatus Peribacteria bacterium]|nr:MAG: peptidoglycan-binding protein [Candidatus Peribacteria bacterium]